MYESQNLRVNTDWRQTGCPLPGNHDSRLGFFSLDELGHRLFCLSGYKRSINIPVRARRGSAASAAHLPWCWELVGKSRDRTTHTQHPRGPGFTSGGPAMEALHGPSANLLIMPLTWLHYNNMWVRMTVRNMHPREICELKMYLFKIASCLCYLMISLPIEFKFSHICYADTTQQ